ncbi:hypothetical protein U9M48_034984 [Paspalum notatum var. saurae]|uniref:Uncharacterized protein n=1 Tax=Paspalum notatum var. saurae TaxID=547442 RepID=A0AAQ3UEP8_PASNO
MKVRRLLIVAPVASTAFLRLSWPAASIASPPLSGQQPPPTLPLGLVETAPPPDNPGPNPNLSVTGGERGGGARSGPWAAGGRTLVGEGRGSRPPPPLSAAATSARPAARPTPPLGVPGLAMPAGGAARKRRLPWPEKAWLGGAGPECPSSGAVRRWTVWSFVAASCWCSARGRRRCGGGGGGRCRRGATAPPPHTRAGRRGRAGDRRGRRRQRTRSRGEEWPFQRPHGKEEGRRASDRLGEERRHVWRHCWDEAVFDASLADWFCYQCQQRHGEVTRGTSMEKAFSERQPGHQTITKRIKSASDAAVWRNGKKKPYTPKTLSLKEMSSSSPQKKPTMRGNSANGKGAKMNSTSVTRIHAKALQSYETFGTETANNQPTPVIVNCLGYKLGDIDLLKARRNRKPKKASQSVTPPLKGLSVMEKNDVSGSKKLKHLSPKPEHGNAVNDRSGGRLNCMVTSGRSSFKRTDHCDQTNQHAPVGCKSTKVNAVKGKRTSVGRNKYRSAALLTDYKDKCEGHRSVLDSLAQEREAGQSRFQQYCRASNEPPKPLDPANFVLADGATKDESSGAIQKSGKKSQRKRRRLILQKDDDDDDDDTELETAEEVWLESVRPQAPKYDGPTTEHMLDTDYYVEEAKLTGDISNQNPNNGRPVDGSKDEDEEALMGAAFPNSSENDVCGLNDGANLASETAVANDHPPQSATISSSEYANPYIYAQPVDEPVWSQNEVSNGLVNEIIESDSALKVTVGNQGKHYLWGVFKRRKETSERGVAAREPDGTACAIEGWKPQDHHLLNQQDGSDCALQEQHPLNQQDLDQCESPHREACAADHVENWQLLIDRNPDGQIDQGITSSSPEFNSSSVTEPSPDGDHGQPLSSSGPPTTQVFHFVIPPTPRARQLIQELASEGALLSSVQEESTVPADHTSTCSSAGVGHGLNHDAGRQRPHHQYMDFIGTGIVEHPQLDVVASDACLELFPVRQEQIGWAHGEEGSRMEEVDLELSLAAPAPPPPPVRHQQQCKEEKTQQKILNTNNKSKGYKKVNKEKQMKYSHMKVSLVYMVFVQFR